ncbi:MAG: hypothetical protein H6685_10370, partial [Deltaproteobacteria bacterium]|nr:hypothetical protein [Deltaproteobacteria bacterium]
LGGDIPRMFHACVEVIENALAEAKLTMDDVPGLRRRLWQLHVVAAREAFRRGKTAMAGDHWDRAVRLKPWDWRTRLGRTWPGRYWQSRRSPIVGAVL